MISSVSGRRVLVVDLNNFARFPTIPVGYLVAVCRRAGMAVDVFSPLSVGFKGVVREKPLRPWSLAVAKAGYLTAVSSSAVVRSARAWLAARQSSDIRRHADEVLAAFKASCDAKRPEVVLISTYLMYRDLVASMAAFCAERRIPVLVGGPYFTQEPVIREWIGMPGLTGLAAGEVELDVPAIIEAMVSGGDVTRFVGVLASDGAGGWRGQVAPPLQGLDAVPFPDYSDFPWDKYPQRIVPIVTGRGCGWGACTFCSDVTSTAGRTFRSRSAANVLDEIRGHFEREGVKMFVFTDIKLNSDVRVWREMIERFPDIAPGATWIGMVHVNAKGEHGLTAADLRQAAKAGCVRLSTGLESGSQRVLDAMSKGTRVEQVAEYLRDATAAGISTRCTMITGYPAETAEDARASARFLTDHAASIERISLNRLQIISGTGLDKMHRRDPGAFPDVLPAPGKPANGERTYRLAQFEHRLRMPGDAGYRRAALALVEAAHHVNRKPLSERARHFEGVM